MFKKIILRCLLLSLILAIFVFSPACKKSQEVTIGVLFPLTGDAAAYGERGKNGVNLAVDEINAQGGIKGRKLRVIYEDSQANPRVGVSAIQKLIAVDKVSCIIGDIVSATTLAIAPIVEKNKVALLSPTASAPAITKAGEYIFRIWPSDLAEGEKIAEFAYREEFKKISILYMQNDYGIAIKDIFSETITCVGGKVISALGYKPDETDFRGYLTRVVAQKPQAVYVAGYFKDSALILKQARELGIKIQFLGTTAIEDPKFLEIAGAGAEGIIYPVATGYDPKGGEKIVKHFTNSFKKRYGKEPGWVEAQAYDAVKVIAYAMEKGGIRGPEIQKAMTKIKGFKGVTGEITFDRYGDVIKPIQIKVVKEGKFQPYQYK